MYRADVCCSTSKSSRSEARNLPTIVDEAFFSPPRPLLPRSLRSLRSRPLLLRSRPLDDSAGPSDTSTAGGSPKSAARSGSSELRTRLVSPGATGLGSSRASPPSCR